MTTKLKQLKDEVENYILKDTNNTVIKHSPEFATNKQITTPTNRLLLSLFSLERLKYFLQYAIVYVERKDKEDNITLEKHIMRYPQFFATKAIQNKLDKDIKKGIIWHTQGSGKTALAYYNIKILKDYVWLEENGSFVYVIRNGKIEKIEIDILADGNTFFIAENTLLPTDLLIMQNVNPADIGKNATTKNKDTK